LQLHVVNRLESKQPWTLAKEKDTEALGTTLYTAAEVLRVAASLLYPVIPEKIGELRKALGLKEEPSMDKLREWGYLKPGTPVVQTGALFPRIQVENSASTEDVKSKAKESKKVEEKKTDPAAEEDQPEGVVLIDYNDFAKVELRTARVVSAEKMPGATKVLKIEVAIGNEKRQMVAGIALHYEPEDLIGKTVVVVANLKPAKIRGVESQGMLLAASKGEKLCLITVDDDLSSGAVVK